MSLSQRESRHAGSRATPRGLPQGRRCCARGWWGPRASKQGCSKDDSIQSHLEPNGLPQKCILDGDVLPWHHVWLRIPHCTGAVASPLCTGS